MFLANENFPKPGIQYLRERGYTVTSIQELYIGISDSEVVRIASAQNLVILTFDNDYGELIFRYAVENPPSVIYFRSKGSDPYSVGPVLDNLIVLSQIQIADAFTVIDRNSIRQRFYHR